MKKWTVFGLALVSLIGCSADLTLPDPGDPAFAPGGGPGGGGGGGSGGGSTPLYQLQFVDESTLSLTYAAGVVPPQGEITSPKFPTGGIPMNAKDPWRSVSVPAVAQMTLAEPTQADLSSAGCNPSLAAILRLVAAADTTLGGWAYPNVPGNPSYAGAWTGDLTLSLGKGTGGYLSFAGYRSDGSGGAIQNVVSQGNVVQQWKAADNSWFLIRFTNAAFAFGSDSTPDGVTPITAPGPGKKLACANFAVLATRTN